MLRLMLNNHPALAIPFESVFIPEFYRRLDEYGDLNEPRNVRRLVDDIAAHRFVLRGGLLRDREAVLKRPVQGYADVVAAIFRAHADRAGKRRWGDKTPSYVTELDVLCRLFPDCRIIQLVRDGRDVALSLGKVRWGPSQLPQIAEEWRWKTLVGHKMGAMLGDRYLEVRYEDLVLDTEATLERICGFLGESYDANMMRYADTAAAHLPAESLQWHGSSIRPPDAAKVFAWKRELSRADRIIFEQIAGDALECFGYEVSHAKATFRSRLRVLYYTFLKRW